MSRITRRVTLGPTSLESFEISLVAILRFRRTSTRPTDLSPNISDTLIQTNFSGILKGLFSTFPPHHLTFNLALEDSPRTPAGRVQYPAGNSGSHDMLDLGRSFPIGLFPGGRVIVTEYMIDTLYWFLHRHFSSISPTLNPFPDGPP